MRESVQNGIYDYMKIYAKYLAGSMKIKYNKGLRDTPSRCRRRWRRSSARSAGQTRFSSSRQS